MECRSIHGVRWVTPDIGQRKAYHIPLETHDRLDFSRRSPIGVSDLLKSRFCGGVDVFERGAVFKCGGVAVFVLGGYLKDL